MKLLFHCLALLGLCAIGQAARIKDVALVEGGRDNQIVGYGLVVGLAGEGDSNSTSTLRSIANAMQRYDLTLSPQDIKAKNVAAVMVTAVRRQCLGVRVSGALFRPDGGPLLKTAVFEACSRPVARPDRRPHLRGFQGTQCDV